MTHALVELEHCSRNLKAWLNPTVRQINITFRICGIFVQPSRKHMGGSQNRGPLLEVLKGNQRRPPTWMGCPISTPILKETEEPPPPYSQRCTTTVPAVSVSLQNACNFSSQLPFAFFAPLETNEKIGPVGIDPFNQQGILFFCAFFV